MKVMEPTRVKRSYAQQLDALPEVVFPLFCPVRKFERVKGWDPTAVYTHSRLVEVDYVFITRDRNTEAIWMVTDYDPENFRLAFAKITPGSTAGRINISLEANEMGGTLALVTYTYIALSEAGREAVHQFTQEVYETFMKRWEAALNHYLRTGEKLDVDDFRTRKI